LVFAGAAGQQAPIGTGDQETRISVDVKLVVLNAVVRDRRGRSISDLQQADFEVYEDGVFQEIRFFSHEDIPVAAGLVVDHSGSMRRKLSEVSLAARTFAESSNPGDQIFVVNFNEAVFLGLPATVRFTGDAGELERAISGAPATGKTALYDAIVAALKQLKTCTLDKKVLVVISDGGDNASTHNLDSASSMRTIRTAIPRCSAAWQTGPADSHSSPMKPALSPPSAPVLRSTSGINTPSATLPPSRRSPATTGRFE